MCIKKKCDKTFYYVSSIYDKFAISVVRVYAESKTTYYIHNWKRDSIEKCRVNEGYRDGKFCESLEEAKHFKKALILNAIKVCDNAVRSQQAMSEMWRGLLDKESESNGSGEEV